jgi:hypothetical protein
LFLHVDLASRQALSLDYARLRDLRFGSFRTAEGDRSLCNLDLDNDPRARLSHLTGAAAKHGNASIIIRRIEFVDRYREPCGRHPYTRLISVRELDAGGLEGPLDSRQVIWARQTTSFLEISDGALTQIRARRQLGL